ncbi:transcriptional regulator [Nocardiopsis dassonvillei subsp. albirubida]|uniref:Transcriptional regulator n=2 Tax=Nocardiopsis alborubida TaxID=146802 RepID=A0A7X6M831_9ACTN|nr:transcriptional regulator [Nocardiopsis alborubida]
MRTVLRKRDISSLFRIIGAHGISQSRLGSVVGMSQARVSEIVSGSRTVTAMAVYERIAEGLGMPDPARVVFGLAPLHPAGLDHLGASGRAEVIEVYPSQSAATGEIRTRAAKASSLEVLAVRGLGIVGMNDSLLRNAVRKGKVRLRLLLLDPECPAAAHRAEEIGESTGSFTAGIRLAIARVQELSQGDNVELYLYDRLPVWRVIAIDNLLYLSAFGADWEGHSSAMYKLAPTPYGALHRGVRRHMEDLQCGARRLL